MLLTGKGKRDLFQSTLPGWGATGPSLRYATAQVTFQSTLPGWGAAVLVTVTRWLGKNFNPCSPGGERRPSFNFLGGFRAYFNPRSPGGERRQQWAFLGFAVFISIHAPRVGSDDIALLLYY